jgi:rod shape-determining protein MreB
LNGLPKAVMVDEAQVREAIAKSINRITENIKITLEATPPELVADIYENGIYLSGGGALLRGLDKHLSQAAKIPVRLVDDPLTCVVRGLGTLLSDDDLLKKVLAQGGGQV